MESVFLLLAVCQGLFLCVFAPRELAVALEAPRVRTALGAGLGCGFWRRRGEGAAADDTLLRSHFFLRSVSLIISNITLGTTLSTRHPLRLFFYKRKKIVGRDNMEGLRQSLHSDSRPSSFPRLCRYCSPRRYLLKILSFLFIFPDL